MEIFYDYLSLHNIYQKLDLFSKTVSVLIFNNSVIQILQ